MTGLETAEKLSRKYAISIDDFLKLSTCSVLKEKKKKFQNERIEILSRYHIKSKEEFAAKIKSGEIQEHPGWEDLIELKNIESEIKEINGDLYSLQTA